MPFPLTFFIWLGATILQALLVRPRVESRRPPGADEFSAPTATEGRRVPIIVGKVKVSGANVVWYGDVTAVAITQEVGGFLGIGGKDVTTGYQFRVGAQMALCRGPVDGIDRVWMGDKVVKSGETGGADMAIQDLEFFGGEGSGGGIDFTLQVRLGAIDQLASPYLAQFQDPLPNYQKTAYVVLNDGATGPGYIGDRNQLVPIAFEVYWYPNTLAVTGGRERIGDDANPICFLYELLTVDQDWGVQLPGSDILVTGTAAEGALRALAEQVADEGLGFSMLIERPLEARELIDEIVRHVDGAFRLDLADGRFKIVLARPETPTVTLDESNVIELLDHARGSWSETKNEVRVGYVDRAKDYDSTFALDQDRGNLDIVGERSIAELNFPGVKTAAVANRIAARELAGLAFPLARVSLSVDRTLYRLARGQAFTLNWPPENIAGLAMRVVRIRYGDDTAKAMRVDAVQDVFLLQTTGYVDPPATLWQPPVADPAAPLDARLWLAPRQLAPRGASTSTARLRNVVVLAARQGGLQLAYDVYTDLDGGVDNFVLTNEDVTSWTPVATLVAALDADLGDVAPYLAASVALDSVQDVTVAELSAAGSAGIDPTSPRNVALIGEELVWWESAVTGGPGQIDLGNVHRGAFGTVPGDHAPGARVWFVGFGAGLVLPLDEQLPDPTAQIRARLTPRTVVGTLDLAAAPNVPAAADFPVAFGQPYAPGDARLNGELLADDDWTRTPGVLHLIWRGRNRFTQALDTAHDDPHVNPPGTTSYTAVVRRIDTDAVVLQRAGIPAPEPEGAFNAQSFIPQTAPGVPDEKDFRVELFAADAGRESQRWASVNFEVFGFGLDFGADFGGRDTGGANVGVVLDHGDPPVVAEPVPGVDVLREWRVTFGGAPAADDQWAVQLGFFGPGSAVFNKTFQVITGAGETPDDLARELFDAIAAETDPNLVDNTELSIVGSTVVVSSFFGAFFGSVASVGGVVGARLLQEAQAASAARRQEAFVDFFDSEVDPFTGASRDVLAPSGGAEYAESSRLTLTVSGLTHAARVALNPRQDGTPIASRGFGPYSFRSTNAPHGSVKALVDLVDRLESSVGPILSLLDAAVGQNTNSPTAEANNVAMQRTALTVLTSQDYEIRTTGPDGASAADNSDTGHAVLAKQIRGAVVGSALSQIASVTFARGADGLVAGQAFTLEIDGAPISYTVAAGDVTLEGASGLYLDPVYEHFAANLPAGYSGELIRLNRNEARSDGREFFFAALYVTRDATNTVFDFFGYGGYGGRAELEVT